MSDSRLLLWLVALAVLVVTAQGGKSGKGGSKGGRGGKGGGDEEIIIPLGTETVIPMGGFGGGGGGGGFEIPLDPAMFAGPQGGGSGGPVGFEETEEIGPDGKPHIISEHQFGGAPAPKLTKAQRQQQKAMQKEMASMAKDMGSMFSDGGFGFQGQRLSRKQQKKAQKAEQDLFKNAMRAFDQQPGNGASQLPIIDSNAGFPSGVEPRKSSKAVPNGWEVTGNSDIFNQAGIVLASCVVLGAIMVVAFRYYKTREYASVSDVGDIETAPFRSL